MGRRSGMAVLVVAVLAVLAACTPAAPPTGPRPLTDEEAQLLAVVRLNNLHEGTRTVTVDIPGEVAFDGWADFERHVGYGRMVNTDGFPAGLVSWDLAAVAYLDEPFETASIPPPTDGWSVGALDPSTSKLAATLLVVLNLAVERAENYLLLQQEGAQWVREDSLSIDGRRLAAQVMRGPSNGGAVLDYWVDADGLLLRVDIDFGDAAPTVILFGDAGGVTVPALPAAPPTG